MKRNIVRISLALVLILSLCLSVSFSAAAKSENKPVACVNAAVNANKIKPEDYPPDTQYIPEAVAIKATIKLLADGTAAGSVVTHNFDADLTSFTININQESILIEEVDGGIKFQFETLQCRKPDGIEFHARFMFWDYGEPGKNDEYLMELWPPDWGIPFTMWIPFVGSEYLPGGGLPTGNVQIHVTESYFDE